MSCPVCRRPITAETGYSPFCSERCKLLDLGKWLGGEYRIPGDAVEPDGNGTSGERPEDDEDQG